jgi:hypothetical protein
MQTGRLLSGVGLGLLLLAGEAGYAQAQPPPPPPPSQMPALPQPFVPVAPPAPQGRPGALAPEGPAPMPVAQPLLPSMAPDATVNHVEAPEGAACPPAAEADTDHWIFTGDYLYMRARRNANDFAVFSPQTFALPNGSIESVDWTTQSGFRVGGIYEVGNGFGWGAQYTYFHTNGSAAYTANPGASLYATMARGGGVDDVTYASADTNLNYQVIDVVASKMFKLNDFEILANGGLRMAFIDQTLNALYNGGSVGALNDIVRSPVYFRGAGLTMGGEGTYHFYKGFGIYGRIQGSLLSGEDKNLLTETNDNGTVSVVSVSEKHESVIPVAELGMGFSWEYEHAFIKIGYELTDWFGLINSPAFTDSTNVGLPTRRTSDLTLEALAVRLGFNF